MFEKVDIQSRVAVYKQIENNFQFKISSGELKPGERLPSVRDLSQFLEVNPNTIAKAYRDLEVMGLIRSRRGLGVYVRDDAVKRCKALCIPLIVGRIYETVSEAMAAGLDKQTIRNLATAAYSVDGSPYAAPPASYPPKKKRKNR